MFEIELIICTKIDLALNNQQILICKKKPILKTPTGHDHTEFGRIIHQKRLVHFNARIGRRNSNSSGRHLAIEKTYETQKLK